MNKLEKLQVRAREAMWFLDGHPAIGEHAGSLFNNIWFSIQKVCKRGYDEHCAKSFQIRIGSKEAGKFKKEFDRELAKLKKGCKIQKDYDLEKHFISIYKKYEDVFGEPWKFDHVEYWGEISFNVFAGDLKKELDSYKPENYAHYDGFHTGARTFEEMVIKLAQKVKKYLGDFSNEDFLTKQEKANHKKEECFFFVKCKDNDRHSTMKRNPKYIRVTDGEINRRWLKWLMKTEFYKKRWKGSFDDILKGNKSV